MACAQSPFTWSAALKLRNEDLAEISQQFDAVLTDAQCLVFWTGVSRAQVQEWADERGLKTLTGAMGPLMDIENPRAAMHRMNSKRWSKYIKGASACFAHFACQGRQALVLTRPPPYIYSDRVTSTYKLIEEPILKGQFGGPCVKSINYIHFQVEDATDFKYQIWPQDESTEWMSFLQKLKMKVRHCASETSNSIRSSMGLQHKHRRKDVQVKQTIEPSQKERSPNKQEAQWEKAQEEPKLEQIREQAKQQNIQEKSTLVQMKKEAKKEANRQKAQEQQMRAEAKKDAKRQKVMDEQRRAEAKKTARRQKVVDEQIRAEAEKEAKRQKVVNQQMQAQVSREVKQQKVLDEQRRAVAKKEAKQQKVLDEQRRAAAKKEAKRQKVQEEQMRAQMRKEANRQRVR